MTSQKGRFNAQVRQDEAMGLGCFKTHVLST